jgi:hypothetical protein
MCNYRPVLDALDGQAFRFEQARDAGDVLRLISARLGAGGKETL